MGSLGSGSDNYKYKYNGKELQEELGLNMYAMDMRQYDPTIARWVVQDPVVHHSMSPYIAFDNNPVYWADPSGGDATSWLNDLYNKSQNGDTWNNNGDSTFTNERNGDTSKCNDCKDIKPSKPQMRGMKFWNEETTCVDGKGGAYNIGLDYIDKKSHKLYTSEWVDDKQSQYLIEKGQSFIFDNIIKMFGLEDLPSESIKAIVDKLMSGKYVIKERNVNISTYSIYSWNGTISSNIFTGEINGVDFRGLSNKRIKTAYNKSSYTEMGIFSNTGKLMHSYKDYSGIRQIYENGNILKFNNTPVKSFGTTSTTR
ncbi:hypothetical protein IF125_08330 [Empedobacter stercoris]|nr:hypothetical protein [Empedobacter stercoris]